MAGNVSNSGKWTLRSIRRGVRSQRVAFPSQIPIFQHLHRPDVQWRMVLLYFVQGWPTSQIAIRYGLTNKRITQLLRQWVSRATERGYLSRVLPAPADENEPGIEGGLR